MLHKTLPRGARGHFLATHRGVHSLDGDEHPPALIGGEGNFDSSCAGNQWQRELVLGSPHSCALLLAPLRCEVGCFWPISPFFFFFEVSVSGGSHPPLPGIKTPRRGQTQSAHRLSPVRPPSARPALLEGCPKEKKEATEGKGARSHSQACGGTEPAARHPPHRAGRRTRGGTAARLVGIREG